ncbi:MAG TPA: hypothetical protein VG204_21185 [Terriglobia bacterium]|nr:hypothetical protein [Terriglobia bacterium]
MQLRLEAAGNFQPVLTGQVEIHEDDLWLDLTGDLHRFCAVRRFSNDAYVQIHLQNSLDEAAISLIIVGDQDSHLASTVFHYFVLDRFSIAAVA